MANKKILVVNFGGIGDLLLSLPALNALSKKENCRIDMLVVDRVKEFAKGLDNVGNVYGLGTKKIRSLKVLWKLRKTNYDLAINMRTLMTRKGAQKIRLIFCIIAAKTSAGRNTHGYGNFFDVSINEDIMAEKSEGIYDVELVKALGCQGLEPVYKLNIANEILLKINRIIDEKIDGRNLVTIHAGGKPSHRWPRQNFVKLIKELAKKKSCLFVLTGSLDEKGLAEYIERESGEECINFAGKVGIFECAAVIKRSDLFITNDTGVMHIGAVMGTPMVAIFGPGYINRYDPRAVSSKAKVVYKKSACAPCDKLVCDDMNCIKQYDIEEVLNMSLEQLNDNKSMEEL